MRIIGWLLIAVSLMPLSAASAAESEHSLSPGEAVIFSIPDVWPWAYEDDDGKFRGGLVEVAHRLSEISGVPVSPQLRPLRRAIVELRSGHANFTILFQSPELDNEAINVATIIRVNILLAAMADTAYPLTLADLKGMKVAYIRGTYLGDAFERDTEVAKVPVNAIRQAVELLSMGRISAILASEHNLRKTLSAEGLSPSMLRYSVHVPEQVGALYMSRVSSLPDVALKFKDAIATMNADGELNRIFYGEARSASQNDLARPTQ